MKIAVSLCHLHSFGVFPTKKISRNDFIKFIKKNINVCIFIEFHTMFTLNNYAPQVKIKINFKTDKRLSSFF